MEKTSGNEKNHGLWSRQLLYEFEDICVGYGIDLQAPVFEITGATKELGAWCPTTKTMRLSRVLITNYP